MKIAILDDYFDTLRSLRCFAKLAPFDVTVWSGYHLKDFALKSASVYDGRHVRWTGTRTFRCRRLEATSEEEVLLDVDGEQPGRLPATFELLPGALRLQV